MEGMERKDFVREENTGLSEDPYDSNPDEDKV